MSAEVSPQAQAEALYNDGNLAIADGDLLTAETCLREALLLAPTLAEAHANLAWLLDQRKACDEALAHYAQAVALQPGNARIHLNHGALLTERRQHGAAEAAYLQALALAPELPGAWSNLGVLLALTGRDDEAALCLRTALQLDPAHASAHFNLACLLLRKGQWEEGWQHLEARDWYSAFAARLACPRWQGEPLAGRSILVGYEAGHGDVLQFCRYISLLRSRGAARVGLVCHPALTSLLSSLDGLDQVMAFDAPWPTNGWDWWVPVLSLPCLFGTRVDTVPVSMPYLSAPADRLAHWQSELARSCPRPGLRVGLVWQGNPLFENDAERSLAGLGLLAPLWDVPGVQFISLQKGRGEVEARDPPPGQALLDLAAGLHDFADTAAVVAQLDLVISVDTAVAHLAGALGKPCWLLLPGYMTDWRWLEERSDSPWYPSLRLFRQAPGAGWAPVVAQLKEALEQRVSNLAR